MSACETKAWGKCACCGGSVAVKCNRSGLAYYRCDHCGVMVQNHWRRTSDKLLAEIGYEAAPAAKPEAEHQAAPAAKPEPKAKPQKAAPGSVASFLGL